VLITGTVSPGMSLTAACVGDCNSSGQVTVDEILTLVNIALGHGQVSDCLAGDANDDQKITIDEILAAVSNALSGCPATPTATRTYTPTPTPVGTIAHTATPTQVPHCGDGVVNQSSEECDPPDDSACSGQCLANCTCPPALTGFEPMSGVPTTSVTLHGHGLTGTTTVTFNGVMATFKVVSPSQISTTVPAGATSGPISITTPTGTLTSASIFSVLTPSTFALSLAPSNAMVLQGQSATYAVRLGSADSNNPFTQLATLQVMGLPAGITATLKPPQIAAGQMAMLTVNAPPNQPIASSGFTVSASATVLGVQQLQTANATLSVQPVSTSFIGRTVEDDTMETPLAGVTITFLGMGANGVATGCTGQQTVSDAAGNFAFTNLPDACVGAQLVRYDGTTATSPPGNHASVDLIYTIVAHQVVVSPVLVHLPLIQGQETVMVRQNFPTDQTFTFKTIPFLSVTVYAGTLLTKLDGTQPDPFPLTAVQVPVDRLPEEFSPQAQNATSLLVFIVAFQPANATASQPVAVTFPNSLNTPPGTNLTLFTLDPTRGQMVPYGSGAVSDDGTQVVPNPDPAHAGHNYGLVHFDWHGPVALLKQLLAGLECLIPNVGGVDLASGLAVTRSGDVSIPSLQGGTTLGRIYRTDSTAPGPFGPGTSTNFGSFLDTAFPQNANQINFVLPEGNPLPFAKQPDGTFVNRTVPQLQGAVMTVHPDKSTDLRYKDGHVLHFVPATFQLGSLLTSITDPNGSTITISRDAAKPQQIATITDPFGRSLVLTYDASDHITSVTDPIGRTVQYTYNAQGLLVMVTGAAGGMTAYTYDAQNRLTQMTDARGVVVVQYTYDANGRVSQQIAADGGVTSFSYTLLNPAAPALSPVLRATVTDPLRNQTSYHFNPQGFLLDVTDALGQTRIFDRESGTNRLLSVHGAAGCAVCGAAGADVTFTYDATGNVLTRTDALGNTTSFTYEPVFNGVTSVTDPLGHVSMFTYDAHGNLLTFTDPNGARTSFAYDATGLPVSVTDTLGNIRSFGYDGLGNLTSITDPLGNASALAYDAVSRVIAATDPRGRSTQMTYDNLDPIVELVDAIDGKTDFTYDPNGNLLSLTDAVGHQTAYVYDNVNRLMQRTDSLGAIEMFHYDKNSNLTQRVDRKGQQSTYTYDAINRLITGAYADGATTSFTYDARGRLAQASDSAGGVIQRTYDLVNRLLEEASPNGVVDYTYDRGGRRTAMSVGGQPQVTYNYDADSRVTSITQGSQTVSFDYDLLGRRHLLTLPNGVSTQYDYDTASRLTQLIYRNGSDMLGDLTYGYDAAGNRIQVGGSFARTLLPDPAGGASYDAANRQRQLGGRMMDFDTNGNLTSIKDATGMTTLRWDARDRLIGFAGPNATASFAYDAVGRRLYKSVNGNATEFLYDTFDIAQAIENGTPVSILRSRRIDEPLVLGGSEYYLADALGSVIGLTDATGALRVSYNYEPFGRTEAIGGGSNVFQYTGRENDSTGLYFYRARYYSPGLQRFITEDPLAFASGDPNLYRYVVDNPTNHTDPTGRGLIGVGVGAAVGGFEGYEAAKLQGQSGCDLVRAAFLGAVAGGVVGLFDPTEGVGRLVLIGAAAGGIGDAAGQLYSNGGRLNQLGPFEIAFSTLGGAASTYLGAEGTLEYQAAGASELSQNLFGSALGAGPAIYSGVIGHQLDQRFGFGSN